MNEDFIPERKKLFFRATTRLKKGYINVAVIALVAVLITAGVRIGYYFITSKTKQIAPAANGQVCPYGCEVEGIAKFDDCRDIVRISADSRLKAGKTFLCALYNPTRGECVATMFDGSSCSIAYSYTYDLNDRRHLESDGFHCNAGFYSGTFSGSFSDPRATVGTLENCIANSTTSNFTTPQERSLLDQPFR